MSAKALGKRHLRDDVPSGSNYISPLRRVRLNENKPKDVIEDADGLKETIRKNAETGEVVPRPVARGISVRGRVVWTSYEKCSTGPVARMHLVDIKAEDTLEEMQKGFRDDYENNKRSVDKELMTASLYGLDKKAKGIPADGTVVLVRNLWGLQLFADQTCQFTTSLQSISCEE